MAATPRGGDQVSLVTQLEGLSPDIGIKRLLRGTRDIGVALVMDRGYIYMPPILGSDGQPLRALKEICDELGTVRLWRVIEGRDEYAFQYDAEEDVLKKVCSPGLLDEFLKFILFV